MENRKVSGIKRSRSIESGKMVPKYEGLGLETRLFISFRSSCEIKFPLEQFLFEFMSPEYYSLSRIPMYIQLSKNM